MRDLELALKAAADPTRTRILKLLESGGLCGCQVQAVLGIAPSTVSKHLAILRNAGLVQDRRDGKWIEYSLAPTGSNPFADSILAMLRGPIDRDPTVAADRRRLRDVKAVPRADLCVTLSRGPASRGAAGRRAQGRRERSRA